MINFSIYYIAYSNPMDTFQKIIVAVAIVVFIGSLTWFGITIRNTPPTHSSVYPPTFSACPDYWKKDERGRCIVPLDRNAPSVPLTNTPYDTYIANNPSGSMTLSQYYFRTPGYTPGYTPADSVLKTPATIDFSNSEWGAYGARPGKKSDDCIYREWANRVGVVWDGITNYNQCK